MQRCHELYTATSDLEVRRRSVELLRVVADRRALPWVAEYLANPDMEIQGWGAGIVDQLLWSELVDPEDCEFLLVVIENHPNEAVRERGAFIKEFMGNRETTAV
jgi:HEAT repeat protein